MNKEVKTKSTPKSKNNDSTAMRVKVNLKNAVDQEVQKLNKMKKGTKKIDPSELLMIGLSLITDEHREHLISMTISGKDRREAAYKNYIRKHRKVTKDTFLEMIQEMEININDYLPEEMKKQNTSENSNKIGA